MESLARSNPLFEPLAKLSFTLREEVRRSSHSAGFGDAIPMHAYVSPLPDTNAALSYLKQYESTIGNSQDANANDELTPIRLNQNLDRQKRSLQEGSALGGNTDFFGVTCRMFKPIPEQSVVRQVSLGSGRIELHNMSIAELFLMALSTEDVPMLRYDRLETIDLPEASRRLIMPPVESLINWDQLFQYQWRTQHGVCCDLQTGIAFDRLKYAMLLDYLNMFFGHLMNMKGAIEFRTRKSYCLVRMNATEEIANRPAMQQQDNKEQKAFSNIHMSKLVALIEQKGHFQFTYPVIDCTGYRWPVSLELPWSFKDPLELNGALRAYGFQFIETAAQVPCLHLFKVR
ncbi:hypothetical protein [Chitinophaga rhizosphaerae]|uniref:hypothetical protein n=1 Tax=Chitinophaga rhizosphaerae TaxID=1864947 RepID=UPI000F81090D|nr:hypothetical protein [Chitinophaga rhizosphaerae]